MVIIYIMSNKKIVIIGGGVSGLSCGIFCQKLGYSTTILEKTNVVGGNLTGWYRTGCYIDNCIHWLNGSKNGTKYNKMWKTLGAIDNQTEFYENERFYTSELNGVKIGVSRDLEKTRQEMLDACPQDKKQINKFIKALKLVTKFLQTENKFLKTWCFVKLFYLYKRNTLKDVAKKCKSLLLKNFFTDYLLPNYSVYVLLIATAGFVIGDGKIPKDGSLQMAKRIANTYTNLGGQICTNAHIVGVTKINDKVVKVQTKTGYEYSADYFVFACDPKVTFNILNQKLPKNMEKTYKKRKKYPIVSSFHVAFDVFDINFDLPDSYIFSCAPIQIGKTIYTRLMLKNYNYNNNFAPNNHFVMQIFLLQQEQDYDIFKSMSRIDYVNYKKEISAKILDEVVKKFPILDGKINVIDCWTPLTYSHYFDAYKGSYLSFGVTKNFCLKKVNHKVNNLKNVYIATQWQSLFGGLPNALYKGQNCAYKIYNDDIKQSKGVLTKLPLCDTIKAVKER